MHLFTCEFFLCKECDQRFKNLSAIKEHLLDGEHRIVNQYYYEVIHAKQERGNKEEINLKTLYKDDLCPPKPKKKNNRSLVSEINLQHINKMYIKFATQAV